jgi:O-antigen/teichoic acid export membrane protein
MGIVARQSIRNTLHNYLGVLLGMVNKLILFNAWLTRSEFGLTELLATFMVLGAEVSQLGVSKMITRFFPYLREDRQMEGQFVFFTTLYAAGGFGLLALGLLLFQGRIVGQYAENAPLFAEWYLCTLPIILAYSAYRHLAAWSQAHLRSVLPNFAFNIVLRLAQTLLVAAYFLGWIGFRGFVIGYVLSHYVPVLITLADLLLRRSLAWSWGWSRLRRRLRRILVSYGLYSSLSETTGMMITRVDMLMLGWMMGEATVATYAIAFYISSLVLIPFRATSAIAAPLTAVMIRRRQWEALGRLYASTSLNNLLVCALVFCGIWANLDSLFLLSPQHAGGRWAAVFLSFSALVNAATSINRSILVHSRYYRYDLPGNVLLLLGVVLLNALLIPPFGESGAAAATAIAITLHSAYFTWFVWRSFRIQPFDWRALAVLGLAALALAVGLLLPRMLPPLADIALRSALVSGVYLLPAYYLRLSPDLNQLADRLLLRYVGLRMPQFRRRQA